MFGQQAIKEGIIPFSRGQENHVRAWLIPNDKKPKGSVYDEFRKLSWADRVIAMVTEGITDVSDVEGMPCQLGLVQYDCDVELEVELVKTQPLCFSLPHNLLIGWRGMLFTSVAKWECHSLVLNTK